MRVPFKDKKKYLKEERSKGNQQEVEFEVGWLMKEYDDRGHGNAVSLYALDKGQALHIDNRGTRADVAVQSCYVVEYMFSDTINSVVFTDDDLEGAIDYTLKLIALAKA